MEKGRRKVLFISALFTFGSALFVPQYDINRRPYFTDPVPIKKVRVSFILGSDDFSYDSLLDFIAVLFLHILSERVNIVTEISPKHLTWMFGACHQLCITFAMLITSIIGWAIPVGTYRDIRNYFAWRLAYAGQCALSIVQVILLLTLFEVESTAD